MVLGFITVKKLTLNDIRNSDTLFSVILCTILNAFTLATSAIVLFYVVTVKNFLIISKKILLKKITKYAIVFVIAFASLSLGVYKSIGFKITFNIPFPILIYPVYETYSSKGLTFLLFNFHIFIILFLISLPLSKYQKQLKPK